MIFSNYQYTKLREVCELCTLRMVKFIISLEEILC